MSTAVMAAGDAAPKSPGNSEWKEALSFKDQSPAFAYGFEVGCLYQRLLQHRAIVGGMVHAVNRDLYEAMAERHGYDVTFIPEADPAWMQVAFRKKEMGARKR